MGPDNNGMKITLFRSPFVVAYSNSSSKNKGPLHRLVISALCNTVELHISAAFEKHLQISASDMSTTWIWLNLQTPQTLPVLCRGKKKISAQQACTSCDTIRASRAEAAFVNSEWPELCSTSSPICNYAIRQTYNLRAYVLSVTDVIFKIFPIPVHRVHEISLSLSE